MRRRPGRAARAGSGISAAAVAVFAVALAGCAAGSPAGPTAKTATALPSPAASALQKATCGTALTHHLGADTTLLQADKGALGCFAAAVRRCAPGSLAVTEMGVDIGMHYVFETRAGAAPCQVTELSQRYSANVGGKVGQVATSTCRTASVAAAGVVLGCPAGDVLIPARVTPLR